MILKIKEKLINILRWSEKWTKTDMVYLTKGGFWLTFSQVVLSASAFVLSLSFANFISKETYGIYKYVLSTVGLLSIFSLSGMYNAVLKAVAQGFEGSVMPAVKAKLKWGVIGGFASFGFSIYYYFNGNSTLSTCFAIAGLLMPIMEGFSLYDTLLNGKKLFNISTKYNIIIQLISVSAIISALYFTKNIILIILAYYLSYSTLRCIFTFFSNRYAKNNNTDKDTINYGQHLTLMNILGTIAGNIDKVLLWHFLGPASVAVYSFALAPVDQISSLMKPITFLAFPKFAEKDPAEIKKTLPAKMARFYILVALGVAIYIILTPYFYKIFFPQYIESIIYSQIFSVSLLFFPQKMITTILQAFARKKELYIITTANAIFRITLLLALLPVYGIYGAIFSNILPYLLNMVMLNYFLKKCN